MTIDEIQVFVRDVPDFPEPGIVFKDITPLLANATAFSQTVELLAARVAPYGGNSIVAIESRGFLFGAALGLRLGLPVQLIRKPGKLPFLEGSKRLQARPVESLIHY